MKSASTLKHFVRQSMNRLDIPSEEIGLEAPTHFRTKWRLEQEAKDSGLPWTFLRQPVYMRQIVFGMPFKVGKAFFEYVIVSLKPTFRYALQINRNIAADNYFGMTLEDKAFCERLIHPLTLATLEDWLGKYFAETR